MWQKYYIYRFNRARRFSVTKKKHEIQIYSIFRLVLNFIDIIVMIVPYYDAIEISKCFVWNT